MIFNADGHISAIQKEFTIINKDKQEVPFILHPAQVDFVNQLAIHIAVVVLKARKMGFSSVALGLAMLKFLFGQNERCVSMSFDASAAEKQLGRAKHFLKSFEYQNGIKLPMTYNNKKELVYHGIDNETGRSYENTLRIGTAGSGSFGRGDDITFLHLTEVAFCKSMDNLLSGVVEACVNNAPKIFETTANGHNDFKDFWDNAKLGVNGYKALFYGPEWEYSEAFLNEKRRNLGERLFMQEYPQNDVVAFLTSGKCFFDKIIIQNYLEQAKEPLTENVYV